MSVIVASVVFGRIRLLQWRCQLLREEERSWGCQYGKTWWVFWGLLLTGGHDSENWLHFGIVKM